ncbi:MAG: FitA-like ribbon-helix-helix domain-containing protein [Rhodomicrobium sp.]
MTNSKSTTAVTIRNIPLEIHRALRVRAAQHGRSTEAEIRLILEAAVKNEGRVKLGSLLAQIGRESGGVDLAIERDRTPTEPASFE